ncbi:MAG: EamA family transporter [Helicobacter trogontum]|uniref:Uncharacterized protein n=2 Tax=Helicobacter trogontum TaxID=50960 RepID=A0ABQ0D2T4_9HELI|nr:EamA family transporter [Helicobacter trogontum]MCI5786919.1 EamA family transporter [Helicobacter trogontum]
MQAIILAAGFGSRLTPMTLNKPKPLLEIRGKSILENMIFLLRKGGVQDIIVVTGYKNYLFDPLSERLGFEKIVFDNYATCNSSQSLLYVKDRIQKGTIILNGDLYITEDFCRFFKSGVSQFLSQKIPENTTAWGYIVDENYKILDIDTNALSGYGDGIAYFDNIQDISLFKEKLEQCRSDEYWEYAVLRSLDSINYYAFPHDALYTEIDSFADALHHRLLTPEEIAIQCADDKRAVRLEGITNVNYLITFQGRQKVIRIPGGGTENVINRKEEQTIIKLVQHLNITPASEFYGSGIKMSDFICDYKSLEKIQITEEILEKLLDLLLKLHSVSHKDNKEYKPIKPYEEMLKYEKLANIALTTPKEHKYIVEVARKLGNREEWVLCHRDLQLPNILFNGSEIKLIDFEYAGFSCIEWEFGNLVAELELNQMQIEQIIRYYNKHSARILTFKSIIEGSLIANYIWALWGWIYNRIDLGRSYLFRFQDNLTLLQNITQGGGSNLMSRLSGHILALSSVFFWSVLYVSVKILLDYLSPFELLVLQFTFGYIVLFIMHPIFLRTSLREEVPFAIAGLCGISVYNLFLNLAIKQTYASNVSIIVATAPLFTGIFTFMLNIEKPYRNFFVGFILCLIGIILLSCGDGGVVGFNPLGDLLALISAVGWGVYSVMVIGIMKKGYNIAIATRKIVFYGLLFLIPGFFVFDFEPKWQNFIEPVVAFNFILIVLFPSALCFLMWNRATLLIGAIKTNTYVYLTPIITIIAAMIILDEQLGFYGIIGAVLTLCGVIISEYRNQKI